MKGKRRSGEAALLVSAAAAAALDAEVHAEWGFNPYALIEAAGRRCAQVFQDAFPAFFDGSGGTCKPGIAVVAGKGNNGADAMVMLRYWLLMEQADPENSILVLGSQSEKDDSSPRAELIKSLRKMKVPILVWDDEMNNAARSGSNGIFARSDIIVDGVAGTGLKGPLHGTPLEMVNSINAISAFRIPHSAFTNRPFVVSVDIPSGNFDQWEPGMPIVEANCTLAIEPQKYCLYTPVGRPHAGIILPVEKIFPRAVIAAREGPELLDWESAAKRIPPIRPDAHKNSRGTVEIRAGSPGASGAALIAARGAQAGGAGLIRLVADDEIYPVLASQAAGIMVSPGGAESSENADSFEGRFRPDAILLGPGWGTVTNRAPIVKKALMMEQKGAALVLDADALLFARELCFSGRTILTPHPGEFEKFTGIERNALLSHPAPILLRYAKERNAVIIFKAHVLTIAAPDGRLGVVDGMAPGLAAGGSGDLLAGFCAAIAARMIRDDRNFDAYTCAVAAATLLIASGKNETLARRFTDPLEVAHIAANLAGEAWLGGGLIPGKDPVYG